MTQCGRCVGNEIAFLNTWDCIFLIPNFVLCFFAPVRCGCHLR